ncbi:hypothetical protein DICVIV_12001 [Dictyocaulus viviparus]|uniref:Chorein N-terminal domain-containing protein n=1 Tax=Dictyocaulus viviparus TaxID=29172 RepID=A0A0D8XEC3_DICVI|nr:hypothetical protein DICVIV_12001 [Dictyocaulus viviparus]
MPGRRVRIFFALKRLEKKSGFIENHNGVNVYKKLELKGFSLYWNSNQTKSSSIAAPKDLRDILAPEDPNSAFIIHPCSAELRMERNLSKLPLKGRNPRFKFFLRSEKITMEMTRRQIAELRALNREWARFERARQHRKWRPLTSINENAAAWWRFAYDRVSNDARRVLSRRSWHFALSRAQHLNAYCRAYRRKLLSFIVDPLNTKTSPDHYNVDETSLPKSSISGSGTHEYVAIMKQIEMDSQYSYHDLHLLRETVFRRIMREKAKEKGLDILTGSTQVFETIRSPVVEVSPVTSSNVGKDENRGLYGWITSFFKQDENNEEKGDMFDFGKLDLHEFTNLSKTFNVKEMEEEILDVLNESWDDSTLLRRDVLLAEIAMRLEYITLRFVDTIASFKILDLGFNIMEQLEQRRVLALDLTGVTTHIELSLRQHLLVVSLAVHDMSVQRLRSGHILPKNEQSENDVDQSFMFSLTESTKILLAIGRKESVEDNSEPMFRMLYRRQSPRLSVRHDVEGNLSPISVMYEENGLDDLSHLFFDDPDVFKIKENLSITTKTSKSDPISTIESSVSANFRIPNITMELRRRKLCDKTRVLLEWEAGDPFACLTLQNALMNFVTNEAYVSKIKLSIGRVELTDLTENTTYPLLTTRGIFGIQKPISTSCPDLTFSPLSETSVSSSLPSKNSFSSYSNRKISVITDSKRLSEDAEATLNMTLVDSKHPQFESKYGKFGLLTSVSMVFAFKYLRYYRKGRCVMVVRFGKALRLDVM